MSLYKTKTILVTFTMCSLFLGTGCLQNIASSGFPSSYNHNLKRGSDEGDYKHKPT